MVILYIEFIELWIRAQSYWEYKECKKALDRQTGSLFGVQLLSNAAVRSKREIEKSDTDRFRSE